MIYIQKNTLWYFNQEEKEILIKGTHKNEQ